MNNPQHSPNASNNDEIDLFELIITLWRSKWLIIGITLLCTIIAGIIAFFVIKPSYQSTAEITAPQAYQIDILNSGFKFTKDSNFKPITTEDVYKTLSNSLQSTDLQRRFFREVYLPLPKEKPIENTQANFSNFRKNISIAMDKDGTAKSITITTHNPKDSLILVDALLTMATETAKETVIKNREASIRLAISSVQNAINATKIEMNAENSFKLSELKNAHKTAEKLNITTPVTDNIELFQQGTLALESQIAFLETQKDNYSRNKDYNNLIAELESYQSLPSITPKDFSVLSITAAPEKAEKPTKPNKKLIIAIGFLLGGMLGVMFVLIRQAIRNRMSLNTKN